MKALPVAAVTLASIRHCVHIQGRRWRATCGTRTQRHDKQHNEKGNQIKDEL